MAGVQCTYRYFFADILKSKMRRHFAGGRAMSRDFFRGNREDVFSLYRFRRYPGPPKNAGICREYRGRLCTRVEEARRDFEEHPIYFPCSPRSHGTYLSMRGRERDFVAIFLFSTCTQNIAFHHRPAAVPTFPSKNCPATDAILPSFFLSAPHPPVPCALSMPDACPASSSWRGSRRRRSTTRRSSGGRR